MKKFKIWNDNPSDKQTSEIAGLFEDGEIGIIPTDSIYGIACDALNIKAVTSLCRLKGINPDKTNLSILCSDISMAAEYAMIDNNGYRLLKDNTPGAVTFLFRALHSLPKAFKGRKIVGIRIPECETTIKIIEKLNHPLLSTSVETDDRDYTINPELISEKYEGKVNFIVEGEEGDTEPSTIVDCTGSTPEIVRDGKKEIIL
ncbi:MAG: threonylcarbamoyl-AMP synthase [Muribaculaceae bacterium]|nr:threonylcarbamoyl-AMP synthase [Muribaculaceae bacterium]